MIKGGHQTIQPNETGTEAAEAKAKSKPKLHLKKIELFSHHTLKIIPRHRNHNEREG